MKNNILRFHKEPKLEDLEGLSINGGVFKKDEGMYTSKPTLLMRIPETFRFTTNLEVYTYSEEKGGHSDLIMVEFLTRGPDYWEMGDAFDRAGFRTPEIEAQMRTLCDELVARELAYWTNEEEGAAT